jgi:hypothetical protein
VVLRRAERIVGYRLVTVDALDVPDAALAVEVALPPPLSAPHEPRG